MKQNLKKKKIMTGILVLLLIGSYFMIYSFSADDAEASSQLSTWVTDFLLRIYYGMTGSTGTGEVIVDAVDAMEGVIRKCAHFTEYMIVGALSFSICVLWLKRLSVGAILVIVQLFVSAGLDEFHQYFVPGRNSSFRDVLIDTAGGIAGILIILCVKGIRDKWNRIRERESKIFS